VAIAHQATGGGDFQCEGLETRSMLSSAGPSIALAVAAPAHPAIVRKVTPATNPTSVILVGKAVSPTQVQLRWKPLKTAKILVLQRAGATRADRKLALLSGSATSYLVSGLTPGQSYAFRVQTVPLEGGASSSKNISVMTPLMPAPGPISYSGPITITHGGTYSGNWQSLNPNVPAVRIRTSEPVIIENSIIRSRGTLINAAGFAADLTVRTTRGYGLNPNVRGRHAGRFLDVDGFANVLVEQNYLEGTGGIYLYHYRGDHSAGQTVQILQNAAMNIDGRESNGKGGYLAAPTDDYVQFFQINGVHGLRGARVAWNEVINEPGKSLVEDNISIFNTTGRPDDPFEIDNNYIRGAYPIDPVHDRQYTGGGIMLSDIGSAYVVAHDNQVIDTTNYGMAISAGHDNSFYNNRILSAGVLADGSPVAAQNVGAYIWNSHQAGGWGNNSGDDNLIGWMQGAIRNDSWTPDAATWARNSGQAGNITLATVQQEWVLWQDKLATAGMSVGPTVI
jgi:hypothetical protein